MTRYLVFGLAALLSHDSFAVREGAQQALCALHPYEDVTLWLDPDDPDPEVRYRVRSILALCPPRPAQGYYDVRVPSGDAYSYPFVDRQGLPNAKARANALAAALRRDGRKARVVLRLDPLRDQVEFERGLGRAQGWDVVGHARGHEIGVRPEGEVLYRVRYWYAEDADAARAAADRFVKDMEGRGWKSLKVLPYGSRPWTTSPTGPAPTWR
jgi:hypothetical protein